MGGVLIVPALAAAALALPAPQAWQYQLQGRIELSVPAQVYSVDGFDVPAATVRAIHRRHRRAVCYIDAGSFEPWRPDAGRFPAEAVGKPLAGFSEERWLDIRRLRTLAPIMRRRLRMCARKGFDGVDPDNVDGYTNDTGFPLTGADQLAYNRWLARKAHRLGLAVGLKNDLGQARRLVRSFDFAVVEQCFEFRECRLARPFVRAGKPVLEVEYSTPRSRFCRRASRLGFSAIRKRVSLGPWRRAC
jgi:hypothetical protein